MERDDAKKTPRIRYLTRREMLALMGSTAAAITLAGCGGSEKSGEPGTGGRRRAPRRPPARPGRARRLPLLLAWSGPSRPKDPTT